MRAQIPLSAFAVALLLGNTLSACETALVLAIDVSGSIDRGEYRLQTEGLAAALNDPDVADALIGGQIALSVVHWSGVGQQAVVQDWQRMLNAGDVTTFASVAATQPRTLHPADTAVGEAIAFSATHFADVRDCTRRVIDISGDGPENAGFTVGRERAAAETQGIIINAIAIEDMGQSAPVTEFYRRWGITRTGFVMTARGLGDYPRAIRAKLLRELQKPIG